MYELLAFVIGFYVGTFWVVGMLWNRMSKRCWGQIAKDKTFRCKLHSGHTGQHYWTNPLRTRHEYW